MLINVPERSASTPALPVLKREARMAYENFFRHSNPGGLTPAQEAAWHLEHHALQMLMHAADLSLKAEEDMCRLLSKERKHD